MFATLFNRAPTKKRPTSKTFDLYLTAATVALHDASFHHSLRSNTKNAFIFGSDFEFVYLPIVFWSGSRITQYITYSRIGPYNSFWGLTCFRQPPTLEAPFSFYYQGMIFVIRKCIDDFVLHQQQISVQKGWSILFSKRIKRDLVVVSWWQKIGFSMVFS